ncbi:fibroblast growth factor receptor 3 isoform X4 [Lingula anatina]|uniref:receptor protein-tyrosine kinase n=1 Tax=Lingula anatina TaxID=7574 RepID=A0A1S3HT04_LINAN|nr:fibroblast growth factor receptor 3 isoform X4 [Lingula anatina]|eukprot:XP_013389153.1 fibroblast growth factor receptor 3 isoform X4 [Lingula anatina]
MALFCLSSQSKFSFEPLFVIVILLLAVSGIVTQTTVVGVPGETTTLQCTYTASGTLAVVGWYKGSENIFELYPDGAQYSFGPDKARLSGTLSESTKTTTLNIQQTQCPGDEGQYRCRVNVRGAPKETYSQELVIKVEPSENPVLTTQQLNDQGSTKFMCSGQLGRPAKGITWYQTLNSQQQNRTSEAQSSDPVLNSDGCTYNGQSELRVDVSASDDGAQFTCMIGQKSASVSLTAASNPEITYTTTGALPIIDSAMGSVEFVKGSAVTLICSATGDPQPNFKWFYREELSNTREARSGNRDNSSVLNLNNIQKPGYYECQASNILNQLNDPPSKVLRISLSEPATGATVGGLSGEAIGGIIGAIQGVTVIIVLAYVTYTYCIKKKHRTRGGEKVSQENNAEDEVEELQTFLRSNEETYKRPVNRNLSAEQQVLRSKEEPYEWPVNTNFITEHQVFNPMEEPQYAEIQERDVEIRRQNIKLMEKIGSGAFGQVFRGNIFNLDGKQNWSIAAVKTAKDTSDISLYSEMMKELKVMLELQSHPNVVELLGSCTRDDAVPLIIVEYLPNGNLQDYLRNDRSKQKVLYGNLHGISSSLTPRDLMKFASDVANGMSYLSSMAILHRDLAARNILVAEDRTCKISDFGFAKDVIESHTYIKQSQSRLPIRWMSPEALFDNIYSTQSDVWAYGVLLWEIVTLGSSPYPGMSAKQVMEAVTEGYRMPQPPHCSLGMYIIMLSCWEEVPSSRSTFKDIVNSLDVLLASESDVLTLGKFEEKLYEDIDKYNVEEKC